MIFGDLIQSILMMEKDILTLVNDFSDYMDLMSSNFEIKALLKSFYLRSKCHN